MNHLTRDYDKDSAGALMNIAILNGEKKDRSFTAYMKDFKRGLARAGHRANEFTIQDMKISYCTGCWDCWIKTPGVCGPGASIPLSWKGLKDRTGSPGPYFRCFIS
jgi:multimeric flavodoxin WrbA